jgi:hypothetical protein
MMCQFIMPGPIIIPGPHPEPADCAVAGEAPTSAASAIAGSTETTIDLHPGIGGPLAPRTRIRIPAGGRRVIDVDQVNIDDVDALFIPAQPLAMPR